MGTKNDNTKDDKQQIPQDLLSKDAINEIAIEQDAHADDNYESRHERMMGGINPYYRVDTTLLTGYYPEGNDMLYRPAGTVEIRKWSSIDDSNPKEVYDGVVEIIKSCTKGIPWKQINEADRFILLLLIQDISFVEAEQKFKTNYECQTCKRQNSQQLLPANLRHTKVPEKYSKYYDSASGTFIVKTKSFGDITIYQATIGSLQMVSEWIQKQKISFINENKSFFEMAPAMFRTQKDLGKDGIQGLYEQYCTWKPEQLSLMIQVFKDCQVQLQQSAEMVCENIDCREHNTVKVDFGEGIRSFFLPVSNIDSELL